MGTVRPAAVAGSFYPADRVTLQKDVETMLDAAAPPNSDIEPRALIVPHAGYIYSGPVAATAYSLMRRPDWERRRIVILGPSHFVRFPGLATVGATGLETPLGNLPVDVELTEIAERHPTVAARPDAHRQEHSLEVQVPFLQVAMDHCTILPIATGEISPPATAAIIDELLDAPGVFAVISSDLSHFLDYSSAQKRDSATAAAITDMRWDAIGTEDACGHTAIQSAMIAARRRGWACNRLALANSGDTAGPRRRVVGYGAFVLGPAA